MTLLPPRTLLLIPVYNEAANLGPLLDEIRGLVPGIPVCMINDGSQDQTVHLLPALGCHYLNLPCNLGVGGAMQAGFKYAFDHGFDYAIRLDGDGQHPPDQIPVLAEAMAQGDVDLVVGSRFLGTRSYTSTAFRQLGIRGLAWMLSLACRRRITDPTSGFQMANRVVLHYFAHHYPVDYPEPESLALLSRQGYRVREVGVAFRPRTRGTSSIRSWGTLFYMFKVSVALFVDRCRAVDPRFDRHAVQEIL